eukprot:143630-Rhodomonas_salina.5
MSSIIDEYIDIRIIIVCARHTPPQSRAHRTACARADRAAAPSKSEASCVNQDEISVSARRGETRRGEARRGKCVPVLRCLKEAGTLRSERE